MEQINKSNKDTSKVLATRFWTEIWNAPFNLDALEELITDDYKLTADGKDIEGREIFKKWIIGMQTQIGDLKIVPQEMLVTDDGARVITRMIGTGYNKGMFGTKPDGAPVELHLISILEIENGKISRNWVERSSHELYLRLSNNTKGNF
ncbi:ester cyclase [Aureibaculum luteum]|uniref:ester cyclase n=1 Tax=Aureibaculum luteum TaxID=1548456 RepID=UPI000E54A58A|nr:ester cyclase [Aureibaculum luteum]